MLKIVGGLLVILSCTGAGFLRAGQYAERTRQIRQLRNALAHMETEILYGFTPLQAIMERLGTAERGAIPAIFLQVADALKSGELTFQECWIRAIESCWPRTCLRRSEREILIQLGAALGRSDRENQQKHIRMALHYLEMEEQEAQEERRKYEKLSRTLGFLAGVLLVILMY